MLLSPHGLVCHVPGHAAASAAASALLRSLSCSHARSRARCRCCGNAAGSTVSTTAAAFVAAFTALRTTMQKGAAAKNRRDELVASAIVEQGRRDPQDGKQGVKKNAPTTTAADMKSPLPPAPLFSCSPCVVAACTDLAPAASAPAALLVSPPPAKLPLQAVAAAAAVAAKNGPCRIRQ